MDVIHVDVLLALCGILGVENWCSILLVYDTVASILLVYDTVA